MKTLGDDGQAVDAEEDAADDDRLEVDTVTRREDRRLCRHEQQDAVDQTLGGEETSRGSLAFGEKADFRGIIRLPRARKFSASSNIHTRCAESLGDELCSVTL